MSLNSFPQELIDEIITQLRYCRPLLMFGAIRDLRHTSLVSKKWVPQSRKLLFQEFSIFGKQLDLRGRDTPQSAAYIRHLFLWFSGWSTVPLKAIEDFLPRLKALKNIRTLIISAIDTTKLSQPNISVHFPNGLTVLDLRDCHLDVSTFVALFSSLPVVREFHARKIELSGPVVIPTKPLSGSLRVLNIDPASKTQRDMILPLFAAHPLAYQELHFAGEGAGEHIRSLITASTETLERLSLPMLTGSDVLHGIDLSGCQKLRELSLNLCPLRVKGSDAVAVLASAPPPSLSKITVELRPSKYRTYFEPKVDFYRMMEALDNALYTWALALGPQTLEVSFVGTHGKPVECHLHKFKELGVVVLVLG